MSDSRPVIIITGASRGIGLAAVEAALQRGARVFGVSRTPLEQLAAVQQLVAAHPDSLCYRATDLSTPGTSTAIVQECLERFGADSLAGVVHNAAVLEPLARVADSDLSAWRTHIEVNLMSAVELAKASLPALRLRQGAVGQRGKFIVVSSGAATAAYEGWAAYCVSKAAVNMFVQALGKEEPLVTSISLRPGVVDTEMQRLLREKGADAMDGAQHSRFIQLKEEGGLLDPSQPGSAIACLALYAPHELSGQFINWNDARVPIAAPA
ncbi:hypothetical protein HK105_202105 [Polyrhizophydium stewartii]|uniref:NAD(P)-binding protein n=1 Tax=Polyrhizophydium stewartii TaxID=2732419 RepID=A0ABR4NF68_9FUNG|nr:hypothetical protein HK105_000189 [Polyrhizophydium stewartii]